MNIEKTGNTSFGMSIICKPHDNAFVNYMFKNFNASQYRRTNEAILLQENNPIDVYLSVINKNGKDKIEAEVGTKTFKENWFTSGAKVIAKAVKYANKLNAEQFKEQFKIKMNKILKGFERRNLDM